MLAVGATSSRKEFVGFAVAVGSDDVWDDGCKGDVKVDQPSQVLLVNVSRYRRR